MDDETALIRAITAAPGDDLPRLVYADWLEEYGRDPNRAEFIRIQCSLASGLDWRTGLPFGKGHIGPFKIRERELIEGMCHAPAPVDGERPAIRELTPQIAEIVSRTPSRISFRRGMIENLNLVNSDITILPPDLHVGGDLNLSRTPITALPPDLHVGGDLDLAYTPITSLPSGLHVGGYLGLSGTLITALPPDLHLGGSLGLAFTTITALPSGLHVGGDLNLTGTPITALPPDLHVGGRLHLNNTPITPDAARQILAMPNLSREAKISGLESAGYPNLADEARRHDQFRLSRALTIP